MGQDFGLSDHAALLQHCTAKARYFISCLQRRALWQWPLAVFQDQVHVVARVSHLPGQQIGKSCAVLCRIVVATLLVREQRVCRLLRSAPIKVVLPQIGSGAANHPLPSRSVDARVLGRGSDSVLPCACRLRRPTKYGQAEKAASQGRNVPVSWTHSSSVLLLTEKSTRHLRSHGSLSAMPLVAVHIVAACHTEKLLDGPTGLCPVESSLVRNSCPQSLLWTDGQSARRCMEQHTTMHLPDQQG